MSRCQKGKTNLDFTEARDSEWQWHQLGHMQVCNSLQTDNHASSPPLCFLQAGCPSWHQTNSVKALKEPWCKEDQCCQNPAGRPEVVSRRGRDQTKTRRRQDCCCCRPVATTGRRHELAGARATAHGPTTHRRISDSAPARRTRRVAAAPPSSRTRRNQYDAAGALARARRLNPERKCADTVGTVLVPRAGHFRC